MCCRAFELALVCRFATDALLECIISDELRRSSLLLVTASYLADCRATLLARDAYRELMISPKSNTFTFKFLKSSRLLI